MFNFQFNIVVICTAAEGRWFIGGDHGGSSYLEEIPKYLR